MNPRNLFLGTLLAVTGLSTAFSITACNDKRAPVTPEAGTGSNGNTNGLPSPATNGSSASVTGTPTDNGRLDLPPVTRVPGSLDTPVSSPAAKPAVVQPLPSTAINTSPPEVPGAGPVAAVIDSGNQSEPTVSDAKRLIEDYYAAVNRGAYESAYKMWSSNGQASGKSLRQFSGGYADTSNVSVSFGDPGRVDAGAGQRYIVIPVRIVARQRDQSTKEYSGTYTLGRTVVDGATPAQRAWSIRSADIDSNNR